MRKLSFVRTFCVALLSIVGTLPLLSYRSVSESPRLLLDVSPYVKQKIQEYLDKAWACYQEKDYETALRWWQMAEKRNSAAAQYNIGLCYERGTGVEQDMKMAVKWYRKAADQNFPGAQYNLAYCYAEGKGVEQSFEKAFEWWHAAAELGLPEAQYSVGWCYYEGKGVKQNYKEAIKWYRRAAEEGNADAIAALSELGE
ncbi:MAG: sel1 repeat family protein [Porphyromonadaceae bacterium]|nr:sel1 repeat family protein [Porphyromonadaceae bacterium]